MTFTTIFELYFCLWVVLEAITCYYILTDSEEYIGDDF